MADLLNLLVESRGRMNEMTLTCRMGMAPAK
jgi:hypothetical protein